MFSKTEIWVKPGIPAAAMWRMCTKSPQSRSSCARSGDFGLIHTISSPVVGATVEDALARAGMTMKEVSGHTRRRVRGSKGAIDLGHGEHGTFLHLSRQVRAPGVAILPPADPFGSRQCGQVAGVPLGFRCRAVSQLEIQGRIAAVLHVRPSFVSSGHVIVTDRA